jgi:ribosomal-protein-alanine N-acetyltransferase
MIPFPLPDAFPFCDPAVPYVARWMQVDDIAQVMPIERASFPSPWPASAYRYELERNNLCHYLVLCAAAGEGQVLAYGGFWLILDEAHISTIAVHPDWRGRGLGEMLLLALIETALLKGAGELTLEVRVSNLVAQHMYRKLGFQQVGVRKGYYSDNKEDALIMTTPRVDQPPYPARWTAIEAQARARLARVECGDAECAR